MPHPTKIMLLRHAEKPADSGPPHGVDPNGEKDSESLSVLGWQRAGALACLLAPAPDALRAARLATPRWLYASGVRHHSHSKRPQQTIALLGAKLGVETNTNFPKNDRKSMVADALTRDGAVLICWEHKLIPAIADQILGSEGVSPRRWPEDRFDLLWVFDRPRGADAYAFAQIALPLLPGDLTTPIA